VAENKPFGGRGRRSGNAHTDLMGAVRRSPDQTMVAIHWPSRPSAHTWAVADHLGSVGYELPDRVAHWPVIGAVPGTPAAGMPLADAPPDAGQQWAVEHPEFTLIPHNSPHSVLFTADRIPGGRIVTRPNPREPWTPETACLCGHHKPDDRHFKGCPADTTREATRG
jgi:hypothetical protein